MLSKPTEYFTDSENGGPEKLDLFFKVTQLVRGRYKAETEVDLLFNPDRANLLQCFH